MATTWSRKLSATVVASAMVLSLQAASAYAAPHGDSARGSAVEKGHSTSTEQAAETETEQSDSTCTAAPTTGTDTGTSTGTTSTGTTSGSTSTGTDSTGTTSTGTTSTGTDSTGTVSSGTDSTGTTAGSTSGSTTSDPCAQPQANVNLSGRGKAAEHNPNVDAQGQLNPGTAATKQDSTETGTTATSDSTQQAAEQHVAKVKADSRAQAKADRANGEKGEYLVYVNGKRINMTPVAHNGRTLVPFRRLAEDLGATVTWDPAKSQVTMVKGDTTVVITIGSTTATVNGEQVEMPVAPEIVDDHTVVPLRFIATALGADVDYDETTGAITVITTPTDSTHPGTTTPGTTDPGSTTGTTGSTGSTTGTTGSTGSTTGTGN